MAQRVAIVGGGAAGFFAAIACAQATPGSEVTIFERGSDFLTKVRISGGGRCNVTHADHDVRDFTAQYPRGERELISPLHRFGVGETVAWFEARGVRLKTEADGRMFPTTDLSATIVDCLMREATASGVRLFPRRGIERIDRADNSQFIVTDVNGDTQLFDAVLLATGGARNEAGARLARGLGHMIEPAVPSLFAFESPAEWLRSLPGVSVTDAETSVSGTKLRERGPLLITHGGLSGPAILRLSAWGARLLHDLDYRFTLRVNWLPAFTEEQLATEFQTRRQSDPNKLLINSPAAGLPSRLFAQLATLAGVAVDTRWTQLSRTQALGLTSQLTRTEIAVTGKSLNKDEFVTCGGVRRREVNFRTMESRLMPSLYFAGELLDVDGITGGFNFQNAWTTGWIAGHAMAGAPIP